MTSLSPSTRKSLLLLATFGLLVSIFPWFFSFRGVLAGQNISICTLGKVVGIALGLFGLCFFVSSSLREKVTQMAGEIESSNAAVQSRILWSAVALYAVGAVSHKLRAHYVMGTHAFDLGFFSNICWNTAKGRWFFSSELERNFLGVHVNWILWPISFLYRLFPNAAVLLVAQAATVVATMPILWKFGQRISGSFMVGAMATLLFACSPYIGQSVANDFHPDLWILPWLTAALWAWYEGERSWLLCFCLIALLAKEDVSVVVCGFAAMLLLWRGWRSTGVVLMALSLGVFYFNMQKVIPAYVGSEQSSLLFSRYAMLGRDFPEIAHNLFFNPPVLFRVLAHEPVKYWRFICYMFPIGGLVLFAPAFLLPPLISVLPHLLSVASTQLSLADIYAMPSQPFLFVGGLIGANKIRKRFGKKGAVNLAGGVFIVASIGVINSPRYFKSETTQRISAFREMIALVPPDASAAAQQNIQPHVETRMNVQLFPIGNSMPFLQKRYLENPEYILCDRIGNALPYDGDLLRDSIAAQEADPAYEKIFERENFLLFKRREQQPFRWKNL